MRFRSFLIALIVLAAIATVNAADFGVRVGRYNDIDRWLVGVDANIAFPGSVRLNPNIEYVVTSEVTAGSANVDALYDLGSDRRLAPYFGAGLGLMHMRFDGSTDTETVVNAIAGVNWKSVPYSPYVQAKYFQFLNDSSENDVALVVGFRF